MRRTIGCAGAAVLAAAASFAITCAPVPLGDGPKRIAVAEITNGVVLPSLADVEARAMDLRVAIDALAADPTPATLLAARDAWRSARVVWKQTEAFAFGPAMDLRLGVAIDQWPVDPADVEEQIAGTAELTSAYVDTLGANRKGFHAIEILLFGPAPGTTDEVVIASLTTDPLAARRRAMLSALAENLVARTGELEAAWQTSYAPAVTDPGSDNMDFPTAKSVIDTFVNECVFLSEWVMNERIGKPFGTASGGVPMPELEESGPSDHSIADMAASLRGIRNVWLGTRDGTVGDGLGMLVREQSPSTDRAVRIAIDDAIAAVEAIPTPYRTALVDGAPVVDAALEAVRALKRLLATEVIAVLGATLKFNDNDGD
jgi:predicted lipoprotein